MVSTVYPGEHHCKLFDPNLSFLCKIVIASKGGDSVRPQGAGDTMVWNWAGWRDGDAVGGIGVKPQAEQGWCYHTS